MAFIGIVLLCHNALVVFDVFKCLAGEPTETKLEVFTWMKP